MIYKLQNAGKIAKTVIKATKRAPVSSLDKIPIWKRVFPIMRTVQDDLTEMNKYHQLNVDEYNKTFGTNIQSIPFRTEFPINPVKILPRTEFETSIDVNNMNSPNKNIENIGGYYSRKNDQVVLPNTTKSSAAYHEFEHMGQYGLTNPEVTRWRIEQLVDPEKTANLTDNTKAYFLSEEEFPVHLRQYGENLGIGIGDPYPGDIEFDKLLEENGIGGASTFVKRATSEEKRLMWRAMNGTLFASLPFVSTLFGIQKDKNGGVIKLQKAWTKIPRVLRKAIKGFGETVDKTTFVPAQVKYYGPTMGKTTSIRTNPNLVDFDAIMRDPSKDLLKKYGFSSKYQMFESGNQDAIKEYQDLLIQKMNEFKSNPNNSGKVLVVSQSPVVNPEDTGFQFDNEPSIPSKEVFVSRNVGRGGTTFDSEDWWTNLMQRNPNLKINNRFVSDIEGSKELIHVPKITIPDVRTYHLVDSSMPLSRPISEAERLGLPKGQRNSKIKESVLNWSWQDWFMDRINGVGHIKPNDFDKQSLYRHIPEYRQIEIATKRDGTWLKMPDGSIFEGDPREWVMAQSKAAQGLNFNNYYKLGSGQKPGYTIYFESQRNAPTMIDEIKGNFEGTPGRSAWLTDFEYAKGFANDGRGIGYTYKVYPQKDVTKANFDLQGLDWDSIPVDIVKELNIPESNGFISTNRIVSESPAQIIHLNNVAEGSGGIQNLVNDVIIKGKRKSILGNNGNFDWNDEIIWRKQGGILKAQDGTFEDFWITLPQNQQDSTDFNVRRYWELNGKPINFKEAVKRGMYKKEKDGYHANSIAFNEETGEYEFMKSPNHPTIKYELDWFNSNKAKKFRNKYQLDSTSIPWKYIPKK